MVGILPLRLQPLFRSQTPHEIGAFVPDVFVFRDCHGKPSQFLGVAFFRELYVERFVFLVAENAGDFQTVELMLPVHSRFLRPPLEFPEVIVSEGHTPIV